MSPTSFIAGSRSSFKVLIAPSCVFSFGSSRMVFPFFSVNFSVMEIFSAIAVTTSFSIPSFNLFTILKFDFFPAFQDGSITIFLDSVPDCGPAFSK